MAFPTNIWGNGIAFLLKIFGGTAFPLDYTTVGCAMTMTTNL